MHRNLPNRPSTIIVSANPISLRTIGLILALPPMMYGLFGNVPMAIVTAVGVVWLYFSVLNQDTASRGLSAARLYLPVFFLYSGVSVLGPFVKHTNEIVFMYFLSGLAFLLGWVASSHPKPGARSLLEAPKEVAENRVFRRGWIVCASILTLATYGYAFGQAGTLPVLSANPNVARVSFLINGYVSTIVVVGLHVMIACGFIELLILRGVRSKVFPGLLCLLGLGLALAMSNRGVAVNPLVFALLFVLWRKNYRLRRLVPIGLFGVAALSIGGYFRNLSSWGETYNTDLQLQGFSGAGVLFAPILNYVFGTAQTFDSTIIIFPTSLPFQMGSQFFSPILMQPSTDLFLKQVFGYEFQGFGLALGSVNAFYLDWGPIGTFVGPFVIGVGLGLVYRKAVSDDQPRWIILYCYLLMQLIFSVYGHPFAYLFYVIEPFVFCFLIVPNRPVNEHTAFRHDMSRLGPQASALEHRRVPKKVAP